MPIPPTPKPAFPNVPNLPGVPPVLRQSGIVSAQNNIVLAVGDAIGVLGLFLQPQWGLFTQDGLPAFSFSSGIPGLGAFSAIVTAGAQLLGAGGQSVGEVEFRNDTRVSTAPQEEGAFLSYNKVASPFNGRVSYIISGTIAQRAAFLAQAMQLQADLTLLDLVTPEIIYPNVNVVHHDYRRTARRGISMFEVDIWVEEIRITGTAAYSNTQSAAGADQVNGGTVQSAQATPIPANQIGGIT